MRIVSPLVLFGLCANLAASAVLWQLSPTDSVRVWYPSLFAYVGEHFTLWVIFVLVASSLKTLRNVIIRSDSELSSAGLTVVVVVGADILASIFLRVVSKSVWIDPLASYLRFRVPVFCVLFLTSACIWLFVYRRTRVHVQPAGGGESVNKQQ